LGYELNVSGLCVTPQTYWLKLFRGDEFEDGGGVAFGFDERPDFFDFASFADEEGAADDAHEGAAHELFFLPSAELRDGLVGGIRKQRKIEIVLGFERGLGFDGIGAEADDGYVVLIKIFFCVTKLGRFDGSTGSVGFGVEEEEDALAFEVSQGDRRVVICFETEAGGFGAWFEHWGFPSRQMVGV
jgi:hypothetical protein